jgi:hypothetical protein
MITWTLKDVNEANAILAVLAKLPYEQVGELIPRLREETRLQLEHPEPPVELTVVGKARSDGDG